MLNMMQRGLSVMMWMVSVLAYLSLYVRETTMKIDSLDAIGNM